MTTQARSRIMRLAERDGSLCHYCETPLDVVNVPRVLAKPPNSPTSDHVIPRSAGGCDALGNLVLACRLCNNRRASKPYADYLRQIGLAPRPDVLNRANQANANARKERARVPNPRAYPRLTAAQAREETHRATEAAMLRGIPARTLPPPTPVKLTRPGLVVVDVTPSGIPILGRDRAMNDTQQRVENRKAEYRAMGFLLRPMMVVVGRVVYPSGVDPATLDFYHRARDGMLDRRVDESA